MYIIFMSKDLHTLAMFLVPSAFTLRHSSTLSSAASTAVYAAQWITASGFASVITFSQAAASVMSISSTSTPIPSMPFAASSSITSCPSCPFTPVTRTLINDPSLFVLAFWYQTALHNIHLQSSSYMSMAGGNFRQPQLLFAYGLLTDGFRTFYRSNYCTHRLKCFSTIPGYPDTTGWSAEFPYQSYILASSLILSRC